ncbi:MAG: hypothetical protein P4N24_17360 [Acidobacteriota bacterium]|nr:hypothetical protein [Acidobacteriota bacterium]
MRLLNKSWRQLFNTQAVTTKPANASDGIPVASREDATAGASITASAGLLLLVSIIGQFHKRLTPFANHVR